MTVIKLRKAMMVEIIELQNVEKRKPIVGERNIYLQAKVNFRYSLNQKKSFYKVILYRLRKG